MMKPILAAVALLIGSNVVFAQVSEIPIGTPVSIRTIDEIDSRTANTAKNYAASLAEPLVVNGTMVAPRNAEAHLVVVQSSKAGAVKGRASLTLRLSEIYVNGTWLQIETGETVSESGSQGKKTGRNAAVGAGLGAIIGGIAGGGKGAAIGAGAGGAVGVGTAMASSEKIKVAPETRLTFSLVYAVPLPAGQGTPPVASLAPRDERRDERRDEPREQATAQSPAREPVQGWFVDLDRCEKRGGASVTCYLVITNTKADRDIEIRESTSIVDSSGIKQNMRRARAGRNEGQSIVATVIAEAPLKASVEFPGVDPDVTSLARVSIVIRWKDEEIPTVFRDVPLVVVPR